MSVVFIHPQTKVPQTVKFGFNWLNFFLSPILGISCFVQNMISEGVFCLIFWIINMIGLRIRMEGTERAFDLGNGIQLVSLGIMLFYSIYLGFFSNRLKAYKLIKKGYLVKNASNPAIQRQLLSWKIGNSVVKSYSETQPQQSQTSNSNLDELMKLGKLRDSKVITEGEFNQKKKELLGL